MSNLNVLNQISAGRAQLDALLPGSELSTKVGSNLEIKVTRVQPDGQIEPLNVSESCQNLSSAKLPAAGQEVCASCPGCEAATALRAAVAALKRRSLNQRGQ